MNASRSRQLRQLHVHLVAIPRLNWPLITPLAAEVRVVRNTHSLDGIRALAPESDPDLAGFRGDPKTQAGILLGVLKELGPTLPILAVWASAINCLAQVFVAGGAGWRS